MNKTRVLKYSFLKSAKDRTMVYNIEKYYLIFSQNNIFFLLIPPCVWFLRYGVWQTEVFVILGHFCTFTPLKPEKLKFSKKWKKHLEISSFYISVPKIMIICYAVPKIWLVTDVIYVFHFSLFFALLHT